MAPLSSRNRVRTFLSAVLVTAMTTAALPAFAQTDEDKAAARQLAIDGKKAIDEKRWNDAVDLFTRAESLVHSPTHVLFLARAYVEMGKLVKAREFYLKIKKETLAPTAPKAFHDAKTDGEKELLALEPRIPNLKITLAGDEGKTVVVTMDGAVVNSALIGVAHPVDPGPHTISAKADGLSTEQKFTLAEGANEALILTLKADATAVVTPPTTTGDAAPKTTDAAPTDVPPTDTGSTGGGTNGMRIGSYVAFGVGVVGLGLGTIFLLKANSKKSDADALCPGGACPASQRATIEDLDSQSKSARSVSTIGFVLGGVGIAAGVTLFILSNRKESTATAAAPRIQPWIGLGSVGLNGSF